MLKIEKTGKFIRFLDDLRIANPQLEEEIDRRIRWFRENPHDTRLDNHSLTGRMEGKEAFSITDNIRIVYEWLSKHTVRFLAIGGHGKVYRRK